MYLPNIKTQLNSLSIFSNYAFKKEYYDLMRFIFLKLAV